MDSLFAVIGLRMNLNTIGDHECTIKPYPKLSYEIIIDIFHVFHFLQERLRAWLSDGPDMFLDVLHRHTDTCIGDGDGFCIFISSDSDMKIDLIAKIVCITRCENLRFLESIIRISDELTEEDLFVRIDWVRDEFEKLCHIGGEYFFGHGSW